MRGALRAAVVTVALSGPLVSCGSTSPGGLGAVPLGPWGGEGISLVVGDTGGTADFDCAHGTIDEPMLLDINGHFDVKGVFVLEHGGPVRIGEQPDAHPARWSGSTDGATMSLSVALTDLGRSVGVFSLTFGAPPRLVKCV